MTLWAGRGRGRGVGGKADEKVVLVVYVGNGGDLRLYNYWQCEERKKKMFLSKTKLVRIKNGTEQ